MLLYQWNLQILCHICVCNSLERCVPNTQKGNRCQGKTYQASSEGEWRRVKANTPTVWNVMNCKEINKLNFRSSRFTTWCGHSFQVESEFGPSVFVAGGKPQLPLRNPRIKDWTNRKFGRGHELNHTTEGKASARHLNISAPVRLMTALKS